MASVDVGVIIMNNKLSGQRIVNVVACDGVAWNQSLNQWADLVAVLLNFGSLGAGLGYANSVTATT